MTDDFALAGAIASASLADAFDWPPAVGSDTCLSRLWSGASPLLNADQKQGDPDG